MINNLIFDSEYISKLPKVGEGSFSIVYKDAPKGMAYKIFKDSYGLNFDDVAIERVLDFSSDNKPLLDKSDVVIPQDRIFVLDGEDPVYRGYSLPLVNGCNLAEIDENTIKKIGMNRFTDLFTKFECNLLRLTGNFIKFNDLNFSNIMYDEENDRLVFIDLDFWEKCSSYYEAYFDNMECFEPIKESFQFINK